MCALMSLSTVKTGICLGYDIISCDGSVVTFQGIVSQQNPSKCQCTVQDHTVSHIRSDCCEKLKCQMFLACWYMLGLFLAGKYKGGCQGFCPFFTFFHFLVPSILLLLYSVAVLRYLTL